LNLKSDSFNLNRLQEIDMKKVEALKRAVSEGTYTVPAEDLAPKLMESMFQNTILDETSIGASASQLEAEEQYSPQHTDAPEIPGGAMINRKDSQLVSVHLTDRLAGADRTWAELASTEFGQQRPMATLKFGEKEAWYVDRQYEVAQGREPAGAHACFEAAREYSPLRADRDRPTASPAGNQVQPGAGGRAPGD
jgi:hypothetical protein